MKFLSAFLISLMIVLSTCTAEVDEGTVLIRIKNESVYNFKNLEFNPGSTLADVGELKAGKTSDYYSFETGYHYGYIRLKIDGDELGLTPYDYVGETPLSGGKYTYILDVSGNQGQNLSLSLTFKED